MRVEIVNKLMNNRNMSVRKRNEFLEGDDSEDETDKGYDSDAFEESRGALTGRANKRRKTDTDSDDDNNDEWRDELGQANGQRERDEDLEAFEESLRSYDQAPAHEAPSEELDAEVEHDGPAPVPAKPRIPKSVAAAEKAARKSGVVYISRVPPFMKPQTLKHFLAPHASKGIGRIFLTPEDHAAHVQRVKRGGNKKKSFTDGWVEFVSKNEAKLAAELLNGNIIGGKKGNFYHDDLWNMKYLKAFKWSHLTEQIANENAERAARLREEVRRTRQENKAFLEDVERGKMLEGMERKKKAKQKPKSEGEGVGKADKGDAPLKTGRDFKQRKVHDKGAMASRDQPPELQRVLKRIF